MIRATCFTNLDDYRRSEWPNKFLEVPRVGDYVADDRGRRLRVISITHKMIKDLNTEQMVPSIFIELHH
jgi:hypothetical protein